MVNLYTANITAVVAFYRDHFGFRETFRTPTEGHPEHVELELDGFCLGLGTVEAARRVHGVAPVVGVAWGQLVFWADDVDEAYGALQSAGVTTLSPPHDAGANRAALLADPDGNLVELVQRKA